MAATNPSTILLKGDPIAKEADATEAITPGDLVERYNNSGSVGLRKHSTAGGNAGRLFAKENDIAGDDLNDDYASGEVVQFWACRPGDEVYAWLADGENASIGSFLESNGDGTLKVADEDGDSAGLERTQSIVAIALENVNLSASSNTTDGRIKVEVV